MCRLSIFVDPVPVHSEVVIQSDCLSVLFSTYFYLRDVRRLIVIKIISTEVPVQWVRIVRNGPIFVCTLHNNSDIDPISFMTDEQPTVEPGAGKTTNNETATNKL